MLVNVVLELFLLSFEDILHRVDLRLREYFVLIALQLLLEHLA